MSEFNEPELGLFQANEVDSKDTSDGGRGKLSDSDAEYQHALDPGFDSDKYHHRKSSVVSSDGPELSRRHRKTSCFVHSLLDKEREKSGQVSGTPDGIQGSTSHNPSDGHDSTTHSRLLTKKQLRDMTREFRALSKRMGSVRLNVQVQKVFLLTKAHDETLIGYTREVAQWLLSNDSSTRYTVYVEKTLESNKKFDEKGLISRNPSFEGRLKYWTTEMCAQNPRTFDFVITLGGDGTVLYASWLFQRVVPPVLSLALGSLGFLTKFDYQSFRETLTDVFQEGVTVSLRLRFEGTVMRSQKRKTDSTQDLVDELIGGQSEENQTHQPDECYEILNEIVVDRGPNPTMSSIEILGDDEHFTTVQADGVCVATPTGSTAYNLAAGGSLCHPGNPVILVTAICAHTLSFRPIILPDTIVLRVGVPYDARTSSWTSFDGKKRVELHPGDYVTISASRYPFANVMPQGGDGTDWVGNISRTLQWNSRQKPKTFKEWSQD